MSEEIKKAYKLFNREDLIDDGYERDLNSNIQVFLTTKQMINYMNLQQKVEQLVLENEQLRTELNTKDSIINELEKENKILKENALHNDKVVDKVNWENMLLKGKINKDLDEFNDELNTFKWLENDFKEHSIHYYQLECLVEYLKQLKEDNI